MGILIRDILEDSVKKFADIKAVKWLKKKDILERSYSELMDNVIAIRKSLLAEGFKGKHNLSLCYTGGRNHISSPAGIGKAYGIDRKSVV